MQAALAGLGRLPGAGTTAARAPLACHAVAFADDFSDGPDEESSPPLLPPDDRIWRHPSELGAAEQPFVLDPVAVRRRWLSSQPTRASAWTAGLVGAILATGLVVLGTHLASAFTQPSSQPLAAPGTGGGADVQVRVAASSTAAGETQVSTSVTATLARVGAAVALLEASVGSRDVFSLGVVTGADGTLVAPLSAVDGASSVLVTLPDTVTHVGEVVATDAYSGLALIHVQNVSGLPTASFDTSQPAPGALVWAVGRSGSGDAYVGTVRAVGANNPAGWPVDLLADVPASDAMPGTPLVGDSGKVVAIVTGSLDGGREVAAEPSWLAAPVVEQLALHHLVTHGWLGIRGVDLTRRGIPDGVVVQLVFAGASSVGALRPDDVITGVDGVRCDSVSALSSRLYAMTPGTSVVLTVRRGAKTLFVAIRLAPQA